MPLSIAAEASLAAGGAEASAASGGGAPSFRTFRLGWWNAIAPWRILQIAAEITGSFERDIVSTQARSQPMECQAGTARPTTWASSSCAAEMSLILMTPIKSWLSITGRCPMRFLFMR